MSKDLEKLLLGYKIFKEKFTNADQSTMLQLSTDGQTPKVMVVACSDSRVDPAIILQADPGDLFIVRNVANIVPPYELDQACHSTSAALEFGIRYIQVKHLILLGHTQCAGIAHLLENSDDDNSDFIGKWVSIVKKDNENFNSTDSQSKFALQKSFCNAMTFPWIRDRVMLNQLKIHIWLFDIKTGQIYDYCNRQQTFQEL